MKIFFGFAFEIISLIENWNKDTIFKNLKPELVEKNDPPIIIKIKKIIDKYSGVLFNDTPIFDTLLAIAKKITPKLIFLSIKRKRIKIINNRYINK